MPCSNPNQPNASRREILSQFYFLPLGLSSLRDSQEPLEGGGAMVNNLSKFAKLAWSITRSTRPANNNRGLEGSTSKSNLKNVVELPRPSFLDSLPTYRHEPPKTPPHILLHYSTFKVNNVNSSWRWQKFVD